jgi:2-polyprenyl-6-hydroxyphenyl methylase/3-demethylubiquinone-9 3-methyltransferase
LTAAEEDGRFAFGDNWRRFLTVLNDDRIAAAESSLTHMLRVDDLADKTFLDIGSGSGLFSLAARRLGAQVRSFDFDVQSVACTEELRRRYFPEDDDWRIEQGSVLDAEYLASLGRFDVVYSWGVLHHTGEMWSALANAAPLVNPKGLLFIAIYNDQGPISLRWRWVKRRYATGSRPVQEALVGVIGGYFAARMVMNRVINKLLRASETTSNRNGAEARGMSRWYDLRDWVGGYPFEVARPEQIISFYRERGFALVEMKTVAGHGCNEYVFVNDSSA